MFAEQHNWECKYVVANQIKEVYSFLKLQKRKPFQIQKFR